ncbi:dynamin family protein [Texcoconibacillus texcoconensis]|uniref:Small GTP-binding protein n=1 Tax=Texcoconibacillus texcoconensis TaxID=1095777 RepID=A0A840QPX6_9BACI|nr:dynamin family protein [Texcoconibacillus texcoconensis]MBB5173373.1 small GTP-binding protein [Texcoconibacillus texcoconensis]
MNTVTKERTNTDLQQPLTSIIQQLAQAGDDDTAQKIAEVARKSQEQTLHIGFCGLFSAGKSTLINAIMEEPLLPSSPIPTSANVVQVQHGEPEARVHFANDPTKTLSIDEIENLQQYCRDGDEVRQVDIDHQHALLEDGVQLLDTPGIDSTDPRHQASTQAALHLADVVLFVADYHHVQSEHNFAFMKELKEDGKVVFLVINQMDKHNPNELSLQAFLDRVQEGLQEWGIAIDGIFCTALKGASERVNQLAELRNTLKEVKANKQTLIQQHLSHAVQSVLQEHAEFLRGQEQQKREQQQTLIDAIKTEVEYDEDPEFLQKYKNSKRAPERFQDEVVQQSRKTMRKAHIMPYTTTELARSLIESYQEDFKVGFLFSKKKTNEERAKRQQAFYEELVKNVQANIDWKIKDILQKQAESFHLEDQLVKQALMDWSLDVPEAWLTDTIKQQVDPRNYIHAYKDELRERIEKLYIDKIKELSAQVKAQLEKQHTETYEPLKARVESYEKIENLQDELTMWDQQIDAQIEQLYESFTKNAFQEEVPKKSLSFKWYLPEEAPESKQQETTSASAPSAPSGDSDSASPVSFDTQVLERAANRYKRAAEQLRKVPSLATVADEFEQKAARFENQRFRISLFGAFSAGKSSFANALLGEKLLPVSPNPTTAAINYILPATEDHPTRTAQIQFKTRERIEEEIGISAERLHLDDHGDVSKTLRQIKKLNPQHIQSSLKPYFSFLQACEKGWKDIQEQLGETLSVGQEDYEAYVAEEQKACFVQEVAFYHDSPQTRQGLEFIDTPGADSIYARHTDVTFDFIKNSDVIVYLTYYNHAFSRADSQFLDQLGRVKDQFAMDKMFFLINASDLASDANELEQVERHVGDSLRKSGIQDPRMFSVSSLKALRGEADAGFAQFQEAFAGFIGEELVQLLLESADSDLERGYQLLADMKAELSESTEARERKKEELLAKQKEWEAEINETSYPAYVSEVEKEVHSLFHYVKQRWDFSYREHVSDVFHPSVFTKGQDHKEQLSFCLDELLYRLGAQLKDEAKATALRLENVLRGLQARAVDSWHHETKRAAIHLSGDYIAELDVEMPDLPALEVGTDERAALEKTFRHFKNAKQFFEQDGRKALTEELEGDIEVLAQRYVSSLIEAFVSVYRRAWNQAEEDLKEGLLQELELAVRSRLSVLDGEVSVDALDEMMEQFES